MRKASETFGTILNNQYLSYRGPRGRRKRESTKKIFEEIIVENLPSMEKETINSKKCRVSYRINPRRNTSRHILIKLTEIKHKERILKAAKEKQQVTYKGKPI